MTPLPNHLSRFAATLALSAALGAAPHHAAAQLLPVGDAWEDYLRVLDDVGVARLGSALIRPLPYTRVVGSLADSAGHPWRGRIAPPRAFDLGGGARLVLADPGVRAFALSARPYGPNEALWVGKGLTTAVDAGATIAAGRVTLALHPTLAYAQNAVFELAPVDRAGVSPYEYPWHRVDAPQRFGPDAVWTIDPGQSSLRVALGPAAVGIATESLWWGPGLHDAVLMTNNARGFPHALLETNRPMGVGIGTLEGQVIWGRLSRSEFFDPASEDPGRYVTGAAVVLTPRGASGLHLGLGRVFYEHIPPGGLPLGEALLLVQGVSKEKIATPTNPTGEDARDQMISSFLRWVLPEDGFELWGEWARGDHGWNVRDYFIEAEHSSVYLLGVRRVRRLARDRLLAFEAEITELQQSSTTRVRDVPVLYVHHVVLEGYTQRGQLIGAALGPGGQSQHAGVRLYAPWGRAGAFAQRRVLDNDAYYKRASVGEWCCNNAFFDLGAEGLLARRAVELSASALLSRELNRYFVRDDDHWSLGLRLEARWRPR